MSWRFVGDEFGCPSLYPSLYLQRNEVLSCFDRSVALAVSGAARLFDVENRAKGGGSSFCLAIMSLLPPSIPISLSLSFSLFIFFFTYFICSISLWLCFVPHYLIKTCSRQCYRQCLICKLWDTGTRTGDRSDRWGGWDHRKVCISQPVDTANEILCLFKMWLKKLCYLHYWC